MKLFVSILLLAQIHLIFNGDLSWYVYALANHCIILLLSIFCFKQIKYSDISLKLLSLSNLIYWWFVLIHSFFVYFGSKNIILFYSVLFVYLSFTGYLTIKNINIEYQKHDTLSDDYVYLLYRKPYGLLGLLHSLVFKPYGSVSIYCKGRIYGFRKGCRFMRLPQSYSKKYLDESLYIKTKTDALKGLVILQTMFGEKWTIKHNCFYFADKFR